MKYPKFKQKFRAELWTQVIKKKKSGLYSATFTVQDISR